MIRINLLPTKKTRKPMTLQLGVRSNFLLGLGVIIAVLLLEGLTYYWLDSSIRNLESQKLTAERELVVLKKKVQEVENYEKDKKTFEDRIEIIQKLKKNQRGPVKILDQVSHELPEGVWLTNLSQAGQNISLDGIATTNESLVRYVNNLKRTRLFTDVQLIESRQATEGNIPVYKFQMTFNVNMELI
jgi:type IV pilus assembly protein PilN